MNGNTGAGTAASPRVDWRTVSVVGLFLAMAVLFGLSKSFLFENPPKAGEGYAIHYENWQSVCESQLRPCLRMSGGVLAWAIEKTFGAMTVPMFWDLSRSSFEAHTPWPLPPRSEVFEKFIVPLATYLTYIVVCLSPILLLTFRVFSHWVARLVFVFSLFVTISGLHPTVITAFFNFADLFFSWPRSYYLFQGALLHYDFFALGLVAYTFHYVASPEPKRVAGILLLAGVGQLAIEHLGFVVGVALAASVFADRAEPLRSRARTALRYLFVAGVGSVAGAVASAAIFYALGGATAFDKGGADISLLDSGYFRANMSWLNVVIANFATMVVMALPGAAVAGVAAFAFSRGQGQETALRVSAAGLGVVVAFVAVMFVGVFFLAYPAEMSRQFLPVVLAVMIGGTKGVELALVKWRAVP